MSVSSPPGPSGSARPTPDGARSRRPGARTLLGGLAALAAVVAAAALLLGGGAAPGPAGPDATHVARRTGPDDPGGAAGRATPRGWPSSGAGRFATAEGESPVRGGGGPLRRYRVAVEDGTGQDADAFAATVDEVLSDPRSWIASGELRVQRVADPAADFTVYLATPATSERMCALGGLATDGYTSCRLPGQVIINLARWMEAVPDYGAPLDVYRRYVVNHEVGHELGEVHQACPRPGAPAPVMQQQTYGLDGCVANPWPYLDGSRYEGEPVDGV
ncbi:DUF3152 domain-containing protein [Micromonospora olivasterospora]|uniref:Uncharacterized protein DUF3152 n=1 Tax=Micromonospora olivasterospora TaxID=1880 RepID=A0A562I7J3_MICOL|nr:DUF3152 domain-containing protein [Micromonospora olivasterospora]TWH66695.1 uncharacterized protein DUF3152 [Micromonospora olivasterospora]